MKNLLVLSNLFSISPGIKIQTFFVKLVGLCKHSSEAGSLFWRLDHRQALGMGNQRETQRNGAR